MKKMTILLVALFLAALVFIIPAPDVKAAGHSDHTTYTATASLPMSAGKYYLTKDVELTSSWKVNVDEIRLCLNGHKITQKGSNQVVIQINNGGRLIIEDCSTGETGKITGGSNLGGIYVNGGEFALYGGHITENKGSSGGIAVYNGGKAYLWGGRIHNNESTTNMGGGVYAMGQDTEVFLEGTEIYGNKARFGGGVGIGEDGTVKMRNGLISNNTSTTSGQGGAGVYVNNKGVFEMEGGTITGNKALGGCGAGIFVSGKAIITGGVIYGNIADEDGGGILNNLGATLNIAGGEIYENTAKNGGGIYGIGKLALENCQIHHNTALEQGGGVFILHENPAVSGRTKIQNNEDGNGYSNLCLPEASQYIRVSGALDSDADINITLGNPPAATEPITLTNGLKANSGNTISDPGEVFHFDESRLYGAVWNSGKTEALVLRIPKVNSLPKDIAVKTGAKATFSVDVSGISVSYQWEYYDENNEEWTEISGQTASSITVTAKADMDGRRYRVCVSNPVGFYYTVDAKLTVVSDPPVITKNPASVVVALNGTATFSVQATGKALSYEWQYSTDDGNTWNTWKNRTGSSASTTVMAGHNGYLYRCVVKNPAGEKRSSTAMLTVSGVKPTIRKQPYSVKKAVGETATFTVKAAGVGLSYEWRYSTDNGNTWDVWNNRTGSSASTAVMAGHNGMLYRCVVKNSKGSVTSKTVMLTVTGVKPTIRTEPYSVKKAVGETATFTVKAAGEGLSYEWRYSADNGKTWNVWNNRTESSASTTVMAGHNGMLYRCIVKNSKGSVTSKTVMLTVTGVKPTIRVQPESVTKAVGETATFTVKAAGVGLSYKWQYSTDNGKTWKVWNNKTESSASTTVMAGHNGYLYRCVVTNSSGSTTSSTAKITVKK